jgi:two-component system, OmpR family, sensor histidine kinase SenX3
VDPAVVLDEVRPVSSVPMPCVARRTLGPPMRKQRLLERLAEAERRSAEVDERAEQLAAEAARLREAIDALPHAVVVCNETGGVVLRNRRSVDVEGGRHAAALVDRAIKDVVAAGGGMRPVTQTLELHGPPPRTLQVTGTPMGRSDRPLGTVVLVDDVSELRRLEAVRRDFVANVSHELRTPVGAMGVLAETLAEERDPEVMRRLAARITAEAERAGRLIDGLLDLSRIEAGGVLRHRLKVAAVIHAAVERMAPLAEQLGVGVVVPETPDGLELEGDENQLVSAVANLLENAVKYSDRGSSVEVRTRASPGWLEVTVADHGVGIPAKDLERVFERFYRVDRARSRQTGGTGLGLSIVRHVATNHGGEVLLESEEGIGSTFTLRLPSG